jgi:TPR repeat protein
MATLPLCYAGFGKQINLLLNDRARRESTPASHLELTKLTNMKANWQISLILLLGITFQLPAQQSETNRSNSWHPPASDQIIQPAPSFTATNASATNTSNTFTFEQTRFEEAKAKAEKGDIEAQYDLGVYYQLGEGVARNETEAAKWYRKAAEQGDATSQLFLGQCYDFGNGVTKDEAEAVKWYRKAAQQGEPRAQYSLGAMYAKGIGLAKDEVLAAKWYRKAANQGIVEAQESLGECYYDGKGVDMDKVGAVKWFRKAAEQGYWAAQNRLGACYAEGNGTTKDYVEAYKWLNLALSQGDENAKEWLSYVEQSMTPEQIAEAQQLAREFKPHKESGSNNFTSPENQTATGTGFFITDDGYLISNYHVVKDAVKVRLLTGAGLIDAKVVQVDAANDLALLKADGRFASLPIAASRTVNLGGTVATIGFPNIGLQGFAPKLAKGEIASLSGAGDDPRYFQISVPVQPGNSGGALVDERGNVIGIVSAKLNASAALAASGALPENVNYAVKSSFLLSFLESVPVVSAKLKAPVTADRKFEDVVKSAQNAAVLVLVY